MNRKPPPALAPLEFVEWNPFDERAFQESNHPETIRQIRERSGLSTFPSKQ